ncbi:response regulator [Phenylobacterium zucineum]|nr:response regulator [Phenylobacterium zucineum]
MPPSRPPLPPLIVIVDDDPGLAGGLKFSLEAEGYRVETLETGEALLLRDLPEADCCLVVDERLPGISGLNALAQLRRRGVDLPALLITSNPSPVLRDAAAAAGTPIIEKPLLGDALLQPIADALARGREGGRGR